MQQYGSGYPIKYIRYTPLPTDTLPISFDDVNEISQFLYSKNYADLSLAPSTILLNQKVIEGNIRAVVNIFQGFIDCPILPQIEEHHTNLNFSCVDTVEIPFRYRYIRDINKVSVKTINLDINEDNIWIDLPSKSYEVLNSFQDGQALSNELKITYSNEPELVNNSYYNTKIEMVRGLTDIPANLPIDLKQGLIKYTLALTRNEMYLGTVTCEIQDYLKNYFPATLQMI